MLTVEIRKCTLEDIPTLRRVALQSYQAHYMYLWTEKKYAWWYMDLSFSEQSLEQQLNDPDATFYFVICEETIAGFLKTNANRTFDDTPENDSLELERLYLIHEYTNKGVGRQAVQIIIDNAKKNRLTTIWLKSMESSKAVQFYQNMGFQIIKTEKLPYAGFKDEYRNIHLMRLLLV